jgi:hypothetical protein
MQREGVISDMYYSYAPVLVCARLPALILVKHGLAHGLQKWRIEQEHGAGGQQD